MQFEPGATVGPYEVIELVGRGGMGEVYRARDTRLGRLVAIKVMAPGLADRADVRRRFEVECRLAATLDHPRICAVHDVGVDRNVLYLVMEFLEGESLAHRIRRGPLPLHDVLGYAIEIASALAHAHRRNVIHRDLKPANVFITAAGVKVLDFGLAKLRQPDVGAAADVAAQDTLPPAPTAAGAVIGTPQYMPPERLEGMPADARSDIFGFGTIVYEMAAGRPAFEAATPAGLVAAILTSDPGRLPGSSPVVADLDWIVRRCLAKNPDDRWQSFVDLETILRRLARSSGTPLAAETAPLTPWARWRQVMVATVPIALGILALAAWLGRGERPSDPGNLVALTIPPPHRGAFTSTQSAVETPQLAVSPDGREIAFVAAGPDGTSHVWTRALDSVEPVRVDGTEDASYPFWSPDGRSLAFFAREQLRRIDRTGGPPRVLAVSPTGRGGTWNADGIIVFAPRSTGPLYRVNADGRGAAAPVTTVSAAQGEQWHRWPHFLPGGRDFLFFVNHDDPARTGIYIGSIDAPDTAMLMRAASSAQYGPDECLLYVADDTLLAHRLDVKGRRLIGEPILVAKDVGASSNFYSAISASASGVVAYASSASATELVWYDRKGVRLDTAAAHGRHVDFDIHPSGRLVALAAIDTQTDRPDIRLLDLSAGGNGVRITSSPATDASPIWSPDGGHLVFRSARDGVHNLYTRALAGTAADTLFLKTPAAKYPTHWLRSGSVVYHTNDDRTGWDIWTAPVRDSALGKPLVQTEFDEAQGQFSPDEQWLAYASDASSASLDVYVMPLGREGRTVPVSINGGADPKWRGDGRELYYIDATGVLTAVPFRGGRGGPQLGPRVRLFRVRNSSPQPPYLATYDPTPDGSKFLVLVRLEDVRTKPLTLLLNWRAPARRD